MGTVSRTVFLSGFPIPRADVNGRIGDVFGFILPVLWMVRRLTAFYPLLHDGNTLDTPRRKQLVRVGGFLARSVVDLDIRTALVGPETGIPIPDILIVEARLTDSTGPDQPELAAVKAITVCRAELFG